MILIELPLVIAQENLRALEAGQDLGCGVSVQLKRHGDGTYSLITRAIKGRGDRPPINRATPED